jgi:hypothetical protein
MTTLWPFPSTFPVSFDLFTPVLFDNVDEVIANHPNSLASAIAALQVKLGLVNEPVHEVGGVEFYAAGQPANPGAPGNPTLWANNLFSPYHIFFTDEAGADHDLSAGGGPGGSAYPPDAVVIVQHGLTAIANGALLQAAYALACTFSPGGSPRATDNRALVILPPGLYDLNGGTLSLGGEFVDIIGFGSGAQRPGDVAYYNQPTIQSNTASPGVVVDFRADDALYQGFHIHQVDTMTTGKDCARIGEVDPHYKTVLRDISFGAPPTLARALIVGNQHAIYAVFERCYSTIPGFIYGPWVEFYGVVRDCKAVGSSYAGWDGAGSDPLVFWGEAYDCSGGVGCFGSTTGSGSGTFNGRAERCNVVGLSFGYSLGGDATCSGYLTDCRNAPAGSCCGVSVNGNATCDAEFKRCTFNNRSFGVTNSGMKLASFTGRAFNCRVDGPYGFGANEFDNTATLFNGFVQDCQCGHHGFGDNGTVGSDSVLIRCISGDSSFGDTTSLDGASFLDCVCSALTNPIGICAARLVGCAFFSKSGSPVVLHKDGAILDKCVLLADDLSPSVTAKTPGFSACITQCTLSADVDPLVTNLVRDGKNVVDARLLSTPH